MSVSTTSIALITASKRPSRDYPPECAGKTIAGRGPGSQGPHGGLDHDPADQGQGLSPGPAVRHAIAFKMRKAGFPASHGVRLSPARGARPAPVAGSAALAVQGAFNIRPSFFKSNQIPCIGTTPACAGKTPRQRSGRPMRPDYPRVRGEDSGMQSMIAGNEGLPPRARGRLALAHGPGGGSGTTPACAGKTGPRARAWSRTRDYPRVRGEDDERVGSAHLKAGLPPRARGRRRALLVLGPGHGTTPACAGKT